MTQFICYGARVRATALVMAAAVWTAPVASAAIGDPATTIQAEASVVVVEPVGAGFAFDIMNDTVSAVFLSGDAGDSVSLLMSRRKLDPRNDQRNLGGVVVMTSGVYRIDLLTPVSGRLRTMRSGPAWPGAGIGSGAGSSILFLAQFN